MKWQTPQQSYSSTAPNNLSLFNVHQVRRCSCACSWKLDSRKKRQLQSSFKNLCSAFKLHPIGSGSHYSFITVWQRTTLLPTTL